MKPVLNTYKDENGNDLVVISKYVGQLDEYDRTYEIKKFVKSEVKQLEYAIEYIIISILNDEFGIIPSDSSDEAIESALDLLKLKFGKTIDIVDLYQSTKLKVVSRENKQTCVIDDDDYISIANKVVIKEC